MKILLWFRNDLRIHDNEALAKAAEKTPNVIPVYIFDPRIFEEHQLGFPKTGELRHQFLIESVENLQENLQKIGSNLIIKTGFPEDILPTLAQELGADELYTSEEITQEEVDIDSLVEERLKAKGIAVKFFWQSTLYHVDDLPMDIQNLPDVFTQFRNKVEKFAKIRSTFRTPINLSELGLIGLMDYGILSDELWNKNPKILKSDWCDISQSEFRQNESPIFKGGETEGLKRLQEYFWQKDLLKVYKETRNGMLGMNYSSKFSPWLDNGCISPRFIYE